MRRWLALALFLATLLPESSQAAGESVTLKVGREEVRAYLARPATAPRDVPGLVVIHENWGLNEQIMGVADRLARFGYVAIAPDLFRGKLGADPGLAQDMERALDEDRAIAIVRGSIDYLRKLDGPAGRPVGTIGFGMGGRLSLAAALAGTDVQATIIIYGSVVTTPEAIARLKAPVLGIFAGRDASIRKEDVAQFEAALKESGKDARIMVNEGLGHAFMNEERADFEPEYSKDAWLVMRKWLAAKLGPGSQSAPEADPSAGVRAKP